MSRALLVEGFAKNFGGIAAIDDLSFDVAPGSVHAIIGPNGAGKTTLINILTGVYAPDVGRYSLFGEDVTGLRPEQLAQRGVSRTFQNLQVCMNLGALENVMCGAHRHLNAGLMAGLLAFRSLKMRDAECREDARELLSFVGAAAYVDAPASGLPYGALKRLEIARALASKPRLLLMDEPAAGLNHTETAEIGQLIKRVAQTGVTILLVEHDMNLVMGVADRILVLNQGRRLALGSKAEVRGDPRVIEAYLGQPA